MPSLHPDPLESFRIGWPVARDDGLDDLARVIAEPGFRRHFRLPGGQFALCERDERTGIVAALRDPTATMPLHAHYDGKRWLVCTSIRRIEAVVGRKFALKLEVLKKLHQTMRMDPAESLYHEVELLAPGVIYLLSSQGRIDKHPVPVEWPSPAAIMAMHRKSPEALVEEGLAIVQRSVVDAVGSSRAIVQQSGGLDSNLILHTAVRAGLPIAAHGMVFPGLDCDESSAMRKSCAIAGVAYDPVDYGGRAYEEWKQDLFRCAEYVPFMNSFMLLSLGRKARDCGFQVTLDGIGGDEIFSWGLERSISFLARSVGYRVLRASPTGLFYLSLRGVARRALSGSEPSLRPYFTSGGWHFYMCGMQMLMDEGISTRSPCRDWRLIVSLLPLVAWTQLAARTRVRVFQTLLLNGISRDLTTRAGLGKVFFDELGNKTMGTHPALGEPKFPYFGRLVPDFLSFSGAAGRPLEGI